MLQRDAELVSKGSTLFHISTGRFLHVSEKEENRIFAVYHDEGIPAEWLDFNHTDFLIGAYLPEIGDFIQKIGCKPEERWTRALFA